MAKNLSPVIETSISELIPSQFPAFMEDEGPMFVLFVQKYFEYLESQGNPLYHGRRIPQYRDIDTTIDDFIIHFKRTYLPNIQIETTTNIRQLIKHTLDLYRSRGTERAIDLLFRLVFGVGADVYQPARDILRPSSGRWVEPAYLEVSLRGDHQRFLSKQVVGVYSGAKAFVERYVRRNVAGKLIDILYVSALKGDFQTGEKINTTKTPFAIEDCPAIIGSMSDLDVVDGGAGFVVGDVVDLYNGTQLKGRARVTAITDASGKVSFNMKSGGFGYTTNAQFLVSEKMLLVSDIWPASQPNYFRFQNTLSQTKASFNYLNANGTFAQGANVYTYYANNLQKGVGTVLSVVASNSTAGSLTVVPRSGNVQGNNVYTVGNTVGANQASYVDATASGTIIGEGGEITLFVSNAVGTFAVGEELYQTGRANGTILSVKDDQTYQYIIKVKGKIGTYSNSVPVVGRLSNASATLSQVQVSVGVINAVGVFAATPLAPFTTNAGTGGTIALIGTGQGAAVTISDTILNPETVSIFSEPLSPYLSVQLDSSYGFPSFPSANLATPLATALATNTFTIGQIATLTGQAPGSNYSLAPVVRVYEPKIYQLKKEDVILTTGTPATSFFLGEVVIQASTGMKGLVRSITNKTVRVERLSLLKEFALTTNSTSTLLGVTTGVSANIVSVDVDRTIEPRDEDEQYVGLNAVIDTKSTSANGSLLSLQVVDSGFGTLTGEVLTVTRSGANSGLVRVNDKKQGKSQGYYLDQGGFLSSSQKLYDGYYWQNYSYEVRSSVPYDRYAVMLKNVLHVAGTKAFGAFYHVAETAGETDVMSVVSKS
jgi:hypothetical protein